MPITKNAITKLSTLTVSQRLSSVKASAIKTVRNLVYQGTEKGWSATMLANKIAKYIDPRVSKMTRVAPWLLHRTRFGRPTSFIPKDIRAGTVWGNSLGIARTELNNTWRLVAVDLHKGKPWHTGWNWMLSSAHPREDICDDWAAGSPYKNESELPIDHPNGLCYVEAQQLSPSAFRKYLGK